MEADLKRLPLPNVWIFTGSFGEVWEGNYFVKENTVILVFFYIVLTLSSPLDFLAPRRCSSEFACPPKLKNVKKK